MSNEGVLVISTDGIKYQRILETIFKWSCEDYTFKTTKIDKENLKDLIICIKEDCEIYFENDEEIIKILKNMRTKKLFYL